LRNVLIFGDSDTIFEVQQLVNLVNYQKKMFYLI